MSVNQISNYHIDAEGFITFQAVYNDYAVDFGYRYKGLPKIIREQHQDFLARECFGATAISPDERFIVMSKGSQIKSMLTYKAVSSPKGRSFIEIYNVCTGRNARKQGLMKALFLIMTDVGKYTKTTFWLGIKLDNLGVIDAYAKAGFQAPRLSNKSPSGQVMPFPFISMVYEFPQKIADPKEVTAIATYLASSYICAETSLQILKFDYTDLQFLRTQVQSTDNFEIGGHFKYDPTTNKITLEKSSITKGLSDGTFVVNFNYTAYSFHTHPISAYIQRQVILGTPSIADFTLSFQDINRANFIIALEGIYCLSQSPFCQAFRNYIYQKYGQSAIDAFLHLIKIYFLHTEVWRHMSNTFSGLSPQELQQLTLYMKQTRKVDFLFHLNPLFEKSRRDMHNKLIDYISNLTSKRLVNFKSDITYDAHYNIVKMSASDQTSFHQAQSLLRKYFKEFSDIEIDPLLHCEFLSWENVELLEKFRKPIQVKSYQY